MSAGGEKSKSASQTDGKVAQNKVSDMGLMSYKENFQGCCIEINSKYVNVCDMGMDRMCSMCLHLLTFEQMNFCGEMFILEKGDYPRWDPWSSCQKNDYLLSLRPVCMDPEDKLCLYEVRDFTDRVGSIMPPGYCGSRYLLDKDDYRHFNEFGAHCPQMQSIRRIM
uniref:Beta/gamma crystallin 'Greek key' domain-containing protein n=1 Tax=Monopterus albus TaxID=43700 RepID=A0A3Q3IKH4_MONAL